MATFNDPRFAASGPSGQADRPPRYPALARCLPNGGAPTDSDIEIIAARIWAEARQGTWAGWMGLPEHCAERRRVLALARAALEGRRLEAG